MDLVERCLSFLQSPSGNADELPVVVLRGVVADMRGRAAEAATAFEGVMKSTKLATISADDARHVAVYCARYWRGDGVSFIDTVLQNTPMSSQQRGALLSLRAMLVALTDQERGLADAREAVAIARSPDSTPEASMRMFGNVAHAYNYAGDDENALRFGEESLRLARELRCPVSEALMAWFMYAIHSSAGRLEQAASCAEQLVQSAKRAGDPEHLGIGLRMALKFAVDIGDREAVTRVTEQLREVRSDSRMALPIELLAMSTAHAWEGRFKDAYAILLGFREEEILPFQSRILYAVRSLLAGVLEDRRCGLADLVRAHELRESERVGGPRYHRAHAITQRWIAFAEYFQRGPAAAHRAHKQSLPLHEDLLGIDDCLTGLLRGSAQRFRFGIDGLRAANRAGYADFIEALFAGVLRSLGEEGPDSPELTSSERQALHGMARGLSNKAIAERHGRSLNTVKTQVSSVLRKLGAESRSEAIAIARRRNLIED